MLKFLKGLITPPMPVFAGSKVALISRNPATKAASYMKGERESYYWEPGLDSDVIRFDDKEDAEFFATLRVNVPYEVELL